MLSSIQPFRKTRARPLPNATPGQVPVWRRNRTRA